MKIVNTARMEEFTWSSPKGKFAGAGKEISEGLGRKRDSTKLPGMRRRNDDNLVGKFSAG